MRVVVFGAGGVGGYFGARLAAAGNDVGFIARGRHLEAIRAGGLRVRSALGDIHLPSPPASDDPGAMGRADVVVFTVKLWDTEAAAAAARSLLGGGGIVIPFQNGVESVERIGAATGADRVLGGAAYIAATISEPGTITHTGTMARLRFGALRPAQVEAAKTFHAACVGAAIDAELVADVERVLWEKFAFLAPMSGLTSVARCSIGPIRSDPEMRETLRLAIEETWSLGRARGVALPDDFVARQLAFADGLPAQMKSSMLHDLEAGRRLEAPWLSGAVARMSRAVGLSAPVNATLYAALKPYCEGRA
ncbi:MAG TPA: 2-dehydropantoate 2-reductase [Casimicrobiaceae bacterium]|nr:2-dehydropantoate 2-reductase [Casimicrobiaceae bacterium]